MKNLILSAATMAFILVSCNQKNEKVESVDSAAETTQTTETTEVDEPTKPTAEAYGCSMHPEVTGKKGEKCAKCGMELTEPVTK